MQQQFPAMGNHSTASLPSTALKFEAQHSTALHCTAQQSKAKQSKDIGLKSLQSF